MNLNSKKVKIHDARKREEGRREGGKDEEEPLLPTIPYGDLGAEHQTQ